MIKIPIEYSMEGYAYDPTRPTEQAEAFFHKLNILLDELKTQGAEMRFIETADVTAAEAYVEGLYDDMVAPPETTPALDSPDDIDILSDDGIYSAISAARAAWCSRIASGVSGNTPEEELKGIKDAILASLNKESIIYLSDGTPIYGSTGLVA
jgi:hypothetical protein